jgi:cysteinyl-tRNA synthetase
MSMKYLGETIDIHCGGEDLVFPHHQNEIAQSEAATGKPFVKYWLHNAHLQMGSEKMSKSLGNFYTLPDLLEKELDPVAIRYLLMSTHYRSPLIFSFEGIEQAGAAVMRLRDFRRRLEREKPEGGDVTKTKEIIASAEAGFKERIADDLNISGALGEVFTFVRNANALLDSGKFTEKGRKKALALLKDWDSILDVLTETNMIDIDENEIEQLIQKRNEAREAKNWEEADRIRDELIQKGIILEDSGQGTRWKIK